MKFQMQKQTTWATVFSPHLLIEMNIYKQLNENDEKVNKRKIYKWT